MNRNDAFPSKYLRKEDITGTTTATITHIEMCDVGTEENKDTKPIMSFRENDLKPMVVNSGNWDTCADLFGDESDEWIGKQIEIYVDPNVKYAGKKVGGLRLRGIAGSKASAPAVVVKTDPTSAFWAYAYQHDITKTDATAYLHETGDDFTRALALMQAQTEAA
jgi:hypothetical protein